jgi:hypothetical protein
MWGNVESGERCGGMSKAVNGVNGRRKIASRPRSTNQDSPPERRLFECSHLYQSKLESQEVPFESGQRWPMAIKFRNLRVRLQSELNGSAVGPEPVD